MKLYIGNLPYETSEIDLREFLSAYEPIVDLHMPLDRDTGRPRGFAFVTLSSREAGEGAVEALDGTEMDGRQVNIPCRDRTAENEGYDPGRRSGGGGARRDRSGGGGTGERHRSI